MIPAPSEKPLEVEGVQVQVDWGQFHVGSSFFVPCINSGKFMREFNYHAHRRDITTRSVQRIENRMWGVRIWRTT